MNLKEINNRITELNVSIQKEEQEYKAKIKDRQDELKNLRKEQWKIFIDNKLYCSMNELKQFKEQDIYSITVIFSDGDTDTFSYGDIIQIDENGHFYYSDFNNGIIVYDEDKNKYVKSFYGTQTELDIIGFYDLELGYYPKVNIIESTQFETLINKEVMK